MLIVDASAVAELLLGRAAGIAVAGHLAEHGFDLHAPQLLDIEVLSALRRVVATGGASAERAGDAIADLLDLPVERYAHEPLVPRVWQLRDNFSSYDAAYLALAETLAPSPIAVLTADTRFARARALTCARPRSPRLGSACGPGTARVRRAGATRRAPEGRARPAVAPPFASSRSGPSAPPAARGSLGRVPGRCRRLSSRGETRALRPPTHR